MYEDNEQPVLRRVLLTVVWLVIVVTIAWAFIWLVFFRHDGSTNQGSLKHESSQRSQASASTGNNSNNKAKGASNTSTSGSTSQGSGLSSTSGPVSQQPQTLANTGAGNVFIPFVGASFVGTVAYYVRVRKKLIQ